MCSLYVCCFFFSNQKTAYEMRISDWSSDVCSSYLWTRLQIHDDLQLAFDSIGGDPALRFALTTKGARLIGQVPLQPGDVFVFGRETAGMSDAQMDLFPVEQRLRLPMLPQQRSLNLSNAVAVTVYEAWRQSGYAGSV